MIRLAKHADIPRMVEMGQHFRKDTSYDKYLSDNPECMAKLGELLIAKDGLLVAEKGGEIIGMLGFIIYPHFISGEMIAGEVFWWTDYESRGDGIRLLREMEKMARNAGAKHIQMIAPNDKVAHFYERTGFGWVEETWQKAL